MACKAIRDPEQRVAGPSSSRASTCCLPLRTSEHSPGTRPIKGLTWQVLRPEPALETPTRAPAKLHGSFIKLVSSSRICFLVTPVANETLTRVITATSLVRRNGLPKAAASQQPAHREAGGPASRCLSALSGYTCSRREENGTRGPGPRPLHLSSTVALVGGAADYGTRSLGCHEAAPSPSRAAKRHGDPPLHSETCVHPGASSPQPFLR